MYNTIADFCTRYGAERFAEFIKLTNDSTLTQAQKAERFHVTGACWSRWETKFCDIHKVLKSDVLEFLESHYQKQMEYTIIERGLVDEQRRELRLIKGGNPSREDKDISA